MTLLLQAPNIYALTIKLKAKRGYRTPSNFGKLAYILFNLLENKE